LESISDNVLMQKVQAGDVDKLGLLYQRYKKTLFAYFYRLTNIAATSEDLVQNVFQRILLYHKQFRNDGKFTSWMYSIAHNVFIDYLRKKKRIEYSDDLTQWDLPDDNDLDENILKKEQQNILRNAINQLSQEQRETLILSRFHDLKYREIADILNVSEGTIKVRIFRAMNNLKKIYSKMEN
jgi:RNA polymerase sigma factor (sigma-70 family)